MYSWVKNQEKTTIYDEMRIYMCDNVNIKENYIRKLYTSGIIFVYLQV